MPRRPHEWDAQDRVLTARALAGCVHDEDVDAEHAMELLLGIAADAGLDPAELVLQDDPRT